MDSQRRVCSYCERPEKLKREDIFATFLRSYYPSYRTYVDHGRRKGLHGVAPVVRDVCRVCNNEVLSALDRYMTDLNRTYFSERPEPNTSISFRYEYHRLLRWLLKAWYNDARASDRNVEQHRIFAAYILGDVSQPPWPVTLTVGILAPFAFERPSEGLSPEEHPKIIRFGTTSIQHPDLREELVLARMLTLNSYLFHLFVWREGLAQPKRREFARGLEREWGFKELRPSRDVVTLAVSSVDTLSHLAATLSSGGPLKRRSRPR